MSKHFVYVIGTMRAENIGGPVKVGYTNNPDARLNSLRTGNPAPIQIACVFEFPDKETAIAHERAFHHVLREKRMQGEWFNISALSAVEQMCANVRAYLDCFERDDKEEIYYLSGAWSAEQKVIQERYRNAWEHQ